MKKKNMNGKSKLKRILKDCGYFIIGFAATSFFLMLITGGPNSKTEIADEKPIVEEYETLQELYNEAQIENATLTTTVATLKDENDVYREYLLDNHLLIEVEEEESDDGGIPTFTPVNKTIMCWQNSYSSATEAIVGTPAMVYCPEYSKIRLHFYYNVVSFVNSMEGIVEQLEFEISCKDAEVEKDPDNSNYSYITLDEKGLYVLDVKYEYEKSEHHKYFCIKW